jgi:hypothetical protein
VDTPGRGWLVRMSWAGDGPSGVGFSHTNLERWP